MSLFDFNKIALEYDTFYDTPLGKKIDHVEKHAVWSYLIKMDLEKPLLEIGCGTGHWTIFLRQKGIDVVAIDVAEKMLEIARSKNPENVDFRQMSTEKLDFEDSSFTNIVSIATLEFVDDLDKSLQEIYRVLKPKGFFLIGCLNENSEIGKTKDENEVYKNARFFTPELLQEKLSHLGKPDIDACAIISGDRVLDYPDYPQVSKNERLNNGAFLTGFVQKTK